MARVLCFVFGILYCTAGCSDSHPPDAGPGLLPVEHCERMQAWTCARRAARGDISEAEQESCLESIVGICAGAVWPPDCRPTEREGAACIEALMDGARLGESGACFPDAMACGSPPMFGPMCAPCDTPPECMLCG
jgi:hypothetical protein